MLQMSIWRCCWELLFGVRAKHSSPELGGQGQRMQPLSRADWEGNLLMVSLNTSFFFVLYSALFSWPFQVLASEDKSTFHHPAPCAAAHFWNILSILVIAPRNHVYIISERHSELKEIMAKTALSGFGLLFEYLKILHLESIPLICGYHPYIKSMSFQVNSCHWSCHGGKLALLACGERRGNTLVQTNPRRKH